MSYARLGDSGHLADHCTHQGLRGSGSSEDSHRYPMTLKKVATSTLSPHVSTVRWTSSALRGRPLLKNTSRMPSPSSRKRLNLLVATSYVALQGRQVSSNQKISVSCCTSGSTTGCPSGSTEVSNLSPRLVRKSRVSGMLSARRT